MIVGLFQFDPIWEDKQANKDVIEETVSKFDGQLDWLILPEMCLTGFSLDTNRSTISDQDIDFFRSICKKKRINITFGAVLENRNAMLTISSEGSLLNRYNKNHLFSFAQENLYYTPGNNPEGFHLCDISVSPRICYDLRFQYMFWDFASNTDVFAIIASWPEQRRLHWLTLLQARAIENQSYVIGVNRVGKDPYLFYTGDSAVFAPDGQMLLNCGNKTGIFTLQIDKADVAVTRKNFPVLLDRKKNNNLQAL